MEDNYTLYGGVSYKPTSWVNNIANNLMGIYKNIIPSNIRMYGRQWIPQTSPVTEKDFTEPDLEALRQAILNRESLNDLSSKMGMPTYNYIDYNMYNRGNSNGNMTPDSFEDTPIGNVINSILDPNYRMSSTIGRANYNIDNNGNVILKDRYDFANLGNRKDSNKVYQFLHDYGEKYGNPYDIELNLGNINDWNKQQAGY